MAKQRKPAPIPKGRLTNPFDAHGLEDSHRHIAAQQNSPIYMCESEGKPKSQSMSMGKTQPSPSLDGPSITWVNIERFAGSVAFASLANRRGWG